MTMLASFLITQLFNTHLPTTVVERDSFSVKSTFLRSSLVDLLLIRSLSLSVLLSVTLSYDPLLFVGPEGKNPEEGDGDDVDTYDTTLLY